MNKRIKSWISLIVGICVIVAAVTTAVKEMQGVSANEKTTVSSVETTMKPGKNGVEAAGSSSETAAVEEVTSSKAYEIPASMGDGKELIIEHVGHVLSYNTKHNNPNWVAWRLTKAHTDGDQERSTKFWADEKVDKRYRVDWFEYKESGYDRGHMCPAGDNKWNAKAMHDCFYMTNMCPQEPRLNSGSWKHLEEQCREWAQKEGSIYIVCGPVYKGKKHHFIGIDHKITVPEGFFKAILSMHKGKEKAIAFYYDNTPDKQSINKAVRTVDEIEQLTGLDLFASLDDNLEATFESHSDINEW